MAKKDIEVTTEPKAQATPSMITVVIPIDPLNKNDMIVPVRLDSIKEHYEIEITRGVPTEVPLPVYEVLKNSGYITGLA